MLDANTIIGFIGALVLLVAFLLNQLGRWETTDFEYDFINLIGAALLALYGWQIGSYPILVLFAVWTLFSLKDVLFDGFKNMKKRKKAKQEIRKEEPSKIDKLIDEEKEEMKHEQTEHSEHEE
ncbi:hypothetical protein ACFLZH_00410 [Patescibacteria group bacterium]